MENKKRPCSCVRDCPCYPRCDEMMEQAPGPGQIPQEWWRGQDGMMREPAMEQRMQPGMTRMPESDGMTQPGMTQTPESDRIMQSVTMGELEGVRMPLPGAVRQPVGMPWENRMSRTANMPDTTMEEEEKDWQRLKELYPDMAKIIMSEVEKACDKMEYEGSAMFDVMPDKTRVRGIAEEILEELGDRIAPEQVEEQADLYTMNREPCRNCRPNQNFLGDFIQVLLYQEMFHRRCRHRNCRRYY